MIVFHFKKSTHKERLIPDSSWLCKNYSNLFEPGGNIWSHGPIIRMRVAWEAMLIAVTDILMAYVSHYCNNSPSQNCSHVDEQMTQLNLYKLFNN